LKLVIASIIILCGVVFFLFALFPADMTVSRVIRINAPRERIIREISDLGTWQKWNELVRNGPAADTMGRNEPADSVHLQNGRLVIHLVGRSEDSVITRWEDAKGRSFRGEFNCMESGGQVILQWSLKFHLRWYPWEKLAGMFYDKQLGPLMEKSLLNLRKSLEPA
jgi:hypothetical protein